MVIDVSNTGVCRKVDYVALKVHSTHLALKIHLSSGRWNKMSIFVQGLLTCIGRKVYWLLLTKRLMTWMFWLMHTCWDHGEIICDLLTHEAGTWSIMRLGQSWDLVGPTVIAHGMTSVTVSTSCELWCNVLCQLLTLGTASANYATPHNSPLWTGSLMYATGSHWSCVSMQALDVT